MNYRSQIQSQINDLQKQVNYLRKESFETYEMIQSLLGIIKSQPTQPEPEVKSKRFNPKNGEKYVFSSSYGDWIYSVWQDDEFDNFLYSTRNCYPDTYAGVEQDIWEQVTRRKYETALYAAADWVEGEDYFTCYFNSETKEIGVTCFASNILLDLPRFATKQSAIDAHTRILGDDAERYFYELNQR